MSTAPGPDSAPQPAHPFIPQPTDPPVGFTSVATSVVLGMGPDGSKRVVVRVAKADEVSILGLTVEHATQLSSDLAAAVEAAAGMPQPSRLVVAQPAAVGDALADLMRGAPDGHRPPV